MSDLITFVKERLDEDAATAQAAGGYIWYHDGFHAVERRRTAEARGEIVASIVLEVGDSSGWPEYIRDVDAAHMARQDPAATLARVAALRALVDRFAALPGHIAPWVVELVLSALAAIWRDHPDYRATWKPTDG